MERWEQAFDKLDRSYNADFLTMYNELTGVIEDALIDCAEIDSRTIPNPELREKGRERLETLYTEDLLTLDRYRRTLVKKPELKLEESGFFESDDGGYGFTDFESAFGEIKTKIKGLLGRIRKTSQEKYQEVLNEINDLEIVNKFVPRKAGKAGPVKVPVTGDQLEEEEKAAAQKGKNDQAPEETGEQKETRERREAQERMDAHRKERAKDLKKRGVRVGFGEVVAEDFGKIRNEDRNDVFMQKKGQYGTVSADKAPDAPGVIEDDAAAPLVRPEPGIDLSAEGAGSDMLTEQGLPFELDGFFPFDSEENQALFRKAVNGETDRKNTVQAHFIRWLVGAKGMKLTDLTGFDGLSSSEKQALGGEYLTFIKDHQIFTSDRHDALMPGAAEAAREYARINRAFTEELFRAADPMITGEILDDRWRSEHFTPLAAFVKTMIIEKERNDSFLEAMDRPELHGAYEDEYGEDALTLDTARLNMTRGFIEMAEKAYGPESPDLTKETAVLTLRRWTELLGGRPVSGAGMKEASQIAVERKSFDAVLFQENGKARMNLPTRRAEELPADIIKEGAKELREQTLKTWKQKSSGFRADMKYEGGYEDRLFEEVGFLFAHAGEENGLPYEELTREQLEKIHLVFVHTLGQAGSVFQRQALAQAGADFREGFHIEGKPVTKVFKKQLEGMDGKTRKEFLETEIVRALFDPDRKVEYRPYVLNDRMDAVPGQQTITFRTPEEVISKVSEQRPLDVSAVEKIRTVEDAKNFLEKLSRRWGDCTNHLVDFANNRGDVDRAIGTQKKLSDLVRNFDDKIGAGSRQVSFRDALGTMTTHRYLSEAGRRTLINTVRAANRELFFMQDRDFSRAFTDGSEGIYPHASKQVPGVRELTEQGDLVSAGFSAEDRASAENVTLLSCIYQDLITHDPAMHWNSSEYKNMRDSLKAIHDWVSSKDAPYDPENQDQRNRMMDLCTKAFDDAGAYIKKRGMSGVVQAYGIARRNDALAVMDVLNPQYMKSFSSELPQLSFEGTRMSYTELQRTVKEHVTGLYGPGNTKKADQKAPEAATEKENRDRLSNAIDRIFEEEDRDKNAAREAEGDAAERFRKQVRKDRSTAKRQFLERSILDALSADELILTAGAVIKDKDVPNEMKRFKEAAEPGREKDAVLNVLMTSLLSQKPAVKKAFLKEAVRHLSADQCGRLGVSVHEEVYRDGLSRNIDLQVKHGFTEKTGELIRRTAGDEKLSRDEKNRITTALINAERHLTEADPRYSGLRQNVARDLKDMEDELMQEHGNAVLKQKRNRDYGNIFKDFELGHGRNGTVRLKALKNTAPATEAAKEAYFNQKFSLSDGFKGTLKDLLDTMDKAGLLDQAGSGRIDAFKGLKEAKEKLAGEIKADAPDLMKITQASEAFEAQRALYKELYRKIGTGFSKSEISGVTDPDLRTDVPWEFGADIRKSSTLKAVCELGVFLKGNGISVDEFLADPAKILREGYVREAEKVSIEARTAGKSPAANLANLLTSTAARETGKISADSDALRMPKFAALLTYGEPEQERFGQNQLVNRMVSVDAKGILYDSKVNEVTFVDTVKGLQRGPEKQSKGKDAVPMTEKQLQDREDAKQLDEIPGTMRKYYGAFRNLAVVNDKDLDPRSMIYLMPAGKDGKEQKPFSLDDYIRSHDFDYGELAARPEKIVKDYFTEALKGANRDGLPRLDVILVKMQEGLRKVIELKREEVKTKDEAVRNAFRKLEDKVMDFPGVYRKIRADMIKEKPAEYKRIFGQEKNNGLITAEAGKQMTRNADAVKKARLRPNGQGQNLIINEPAVPENQKKRKS